MTDNEDCVTDTLKTLGAYLDGRMAEALAPPAVDDPAVASVAAYFAAMEKYETTNEDSPEWKKVDAELDQARGRILTTSVTSLAGITGIVRFLEHQAQIVNAEGELVGVATRNLRVQLDAMAGAA